MILLGEKLILSKPSGKVEGSRSQITIVKLWFCCVISLSWASREVNLNSILSIRFYLISFWVCISFIYKYIFSFMIVLINSFKNYQKQLWGFIFYLIRPGAGIGRQAWLRAMCPSGCAGSTPALGTFLNSYKTFVL